MISGDPGVGKTMLTLKLAELSLSRGRRCIFVGCDQPPANTREIVSEIHHSISRISEAISTNAPNFVMVDAFSSAGKLKSEELYHTTGIFDLNEMSLVVADASKDPDRGLTVVVDSVNPLFLHRDASSVLKFLDHCRAKCVGRGDAFLFSITEGAIDQSVYRKLESMADVVIEMKFVEGADGRIRRFRLTKIRGQNLLDEWVYFEVVPKEGVVFRPIEKPEIPA
jgi:archaellum biogenesis ATPase FlaH